MTETTAAVLITTITNDDPSSDRTASCPHGTPLSMNPKYYIKHMQNIGLIRPVPDGTVERALDLGCGKGADAEYLASLGYAVTAVDEERHYGHTIIRDIRDYKIEPGFSVIICNNVLPFVGDKYKAGKIIRDMAAALRPGGAMFFTVYGPRSGFRHRSDMSFYEYDEVLDLVRRLPVEIMDKTTSEGYTKNAKGEIIFQHSHRFILKKI